MNVSKYSFVFVSLLSLLSFSHCRKSDRNNEVINPAPYENAIATVVFNDIFRIVHSISFENSIINAPQDAVQTNTIDLCVNSVNYASVTEQFPNTMVINFGDDQSKCVLDNRIRNGVIRLDFSNKYSDSLSVINVEFIDYYVDSVEVNASMSIANKGRNSSGQPVYKILVTDASIKKDTLNFEWSSVKIYTWISGYSTVSISDDEFEISGSSDGITTRGNEYSSKITERLVTDFTCKWIVSGTEKLIPDNLTSRIIDYGTSCNSTVSVQYYNTTYEFTLN